MTTTNRMAGETPEKHDPTRPPLPAPFPIGAHVRYLGETRSPYLKTGDVKKIVRVAAGHRGTGRQFVDSDGPVVWEDTGEPILDETKDGHSVWEFKDSAGEKQGRAINPKDAGNWERVSRSASA